MKEKPKTFTRDFFVKKGREGGKMNTVEHMKKAGKAGLEARKLIVRSIDDGEVKFESVSAIEQK